MTDDTQELVLPPTGSAGVSRLASARTYAARHPRIGVVIVLLVLSLAVNVALAMRSALANAQLSARASALEAARVYGVNLTTYDYRHLDRDFARVAADSTGSFRQQYVKASKGLHDLIVKYKGSASGKVTGAGVESATADRAVVVLFVDQTVRNTNAAQPRVDRNRVRLTLVHQHGRWLISDLVLV